MRKIYLSLVTLVFTLGLCSAQGKPIYLNGKLLNPETLAPLSETFFREAVVNDNGLVIAKEKTAWGIYNYKGEQTTERKFEKFPLFKNGFAVGKIGGFSAEHIMIDSLGDALFSINCKDLKPLNFGFAAFLNSDYKYGFVNDKGKEIIAPKYNDFNQSVQVNNKIYHSVKQGELWGLINAKGKMVLDFKYENITWLKNDLFLVSVLDKDNPTSKGSFGATLKNYTQGIWSPSKGMVHEPTLDRVRIDLEFLEIDLLVGKVNKEPGMGLLDLSGNTVLKPQFRDIRFVGQNLIAVEQLGAEIGKSKEALADFQGALKTQYLFDNIGRLENGLISVCATQNGKRGCGYIDENAQLKIGLNFGIAGPFNENGEAKVTYYKKSGLASIAHSGIINKQNEPIVPLVFGEINRVSDKYYKVKTPNNAYSHLVSASTGEVLNPEKAHYILRDYGFYYLQLNQFDKGGQYYQQLADLGHATNEDKYYLGLSYGRQGDYEKAIKYLDRVIDLHAAEKKGVLFDATIEKAEVLLAQDKLQEAKKFYTQAMVDRPKDAGQIRLKFAESLEKKQLEPEAIVQYQEVLKAYPNAYQVFEKLGVAQLKIKLEDESIVSFNKAIELNPKSKDAYFYRGQAHGKKGDHAKAIIDLEKAIEIDGSDELLSIHRFLADSYAETNQLPKACDLWSKLAPYDENAKAKMNTKCKN